MQAESRDEIKTSLGSNACQGAMAMCNIQAYDVTPMEIMEDQEKLAKSVSLRVSIPARRWVRRQD